MHQVLQKRLVETNALYRKGFLMWARTEEEVQSVEY